MAFGPASSASDCRSCLRAGWVQIGWTLHQQTSLANQKIYSILSLNTVLQSSPLKLNEQVLYLANLLPMTSFYSRCSCCSSDDTYMILICSGGLMIGDSRWLASCSWADDRSARKLIINDVICVHILLLSQYHTLWLQIRTIPVSLCV